MNVQINSSKKGFTIIEVVLVLAIAGLIFLMVFVALPALNRSQRDQARKTDVSSIASAVTSFTSNNRGSFPNVEQLSEYAEISENITEIDIQPAASDRVTTEDRVDTAVVTPRSTCGTSSKTDHTLNSGTARQFTVVVKLESGGGAYFCLDS